MSSVRKRGQQRFRVILTGETRWQADRKSREAMCEESGSNSERHVCEQFAGFTRAFKSRSILRLKTTVSEKPILFLLQNCHVKGKKEKETRARARPTRVCYHDYF